MKNRSVKVPPQTYSLAILPLIRACKKGANSTWKVYDTLARFLQLLSIEINLVSNSNQ